MCFRTMGKCWKGRRTAREGRENSKTLKNHISVSSSYSERKEKIFLTGFFFLFDGAKTLFINYLPFIETHKVCYCFVCFKNHNEANSSNCIYIPVYFFVFL